MNSQEPTSKTSDFTRKSECESICMHCFQMVRTDRWTPLEEAERIHADVCLLRVESAMRYELLW
jgi:hypothetical protein